MKSLIVISIASMLCAAAICDAPPSGSADYVEGESSQALITKDIRDSAVLMFGANADALLHAVSLTMAKYDGDMKTQSGRRSWHGRLLREEINTNELYKIEVYSNDVTGAMWRYRLPFKPVGLKSTRRTVAMTNGIPARLAAARARRAAALNGETETTNVVHVANEVAK